MILLDKDVEFCCKDTKIFSHLQIFGKKIYTI